ncbi:MAG: helicase [Thermoguttaceae bacterium]|nr:helicase [Thermoguttaceae bacterium]
MFSFRDVLESDGLIARRRPGYERRAAQLAMAAEVESAIRDRRSLVVEAGTGVGKSFAYLVPAILYAVEDQVRAYSRDREGVREAPDDASADSEREPISRSLSSLFENDEGSPFELRRVVVSTHTIGLQEQLFEKDVPALQTILPFEFTAAIAKGRANYVCLRRFKRAKKSAAVGSLFVDELQKEFKTLEKWLGNSVDGSRSDAPFVPNRDLWEEICCEPGNCLGRKCKYYDDCFYYRARRRLDNAQVVIVNHALLFSDVALRREGGSVLPNYDVLIFDEAHTMEQVAAEHIGFEIGFSGVDRVLSRFYNERSGKGLLLDEYESAKRDPLLLNALTAALELVGDCKERAREFFGDLLDWKNARPNSNGRVLDADIAKNGLSEGLGALAAQLRRVSDLMEDEGRQKELQAAKGRVEDIAVSVEDWLGQRCDGFAYWLESSTSRAGAPRVSMCCAPIDVAPILRAHLFNVVPTVVAASATLTVSARGSAKSVSVDDDSVEATAREPDDETEETRRAFAFFRGRVGLTGARARALGSPFNYREQMTLVLAKGLELAESEGRRRGLSKESLKELNERRFLEALKEYVEETNGGVFALFTNAAQMKRTTEALSAWFGEKNYPFFSQSEGTPRQKMVRMFKESSNSVLFGVDSFWQGVDVPGNALRNVIIVKLPFPSPGQPLVEAREERIKELGGNPFLDYALPTAALKFKQGAGRLIRTATDVGQVVVLDERIHQKSYGRDFLRSLPDCKLRVDQFE